MITVHFGFLKLDYYFPPFSLVDIHGAVFVLEITSNLVQVELLAAKNLIAANLNGTSDPYVIITCGTEKRFR